MGTAAREMRSAERWGPVCRGFSVSFADGARGCVEEIRLGDGVVELLVATGLFVRELVTVDGSEVEAILPRARRIVVESPLSPAETDGVEFAGGIVRMPMRHSSRLSAVPEAAA